MAIEENFALGMRDTDVPMQQGQAKTLVNFDVKNFGDTLAPRLGYNKLYESLVGVVPDSMIYHIGRARYADVTNKDEYCNFIVVGPATPSGMMHTQTMVNSNSLHVFVENTLDTEFNPERCDFTQRVVRASYTPDSGEPVEGVAELYRFLKPEPSVVHDTDLRNTLVPFHKNYELRGVQLNNAYYVMGAFREAISEPVDTVFELRINKYSDAVLHTRANHLHTPTVTECSEYGYNMLKVEPYALPHKTINAALESGTCSIDGIYTTRVGETLPALFAYKGERLNFQACISYYGTFQANYKWVIIDLNTGTEIVLKSTVDPNTYALDNNTTVMPSIITQPPSDNFAIMFELWPTADGVGMERFIFTGFPIFAANDRHTDQLVAYNIKTCAGMCEWASRIVYWGVENGKNILFQSDINNAFYVPYPGVSHTFDEPIVHCVPFMSKLLVFTETKLYQLAWNGDGLSYKVTLIQTNLRLSAYDCNTVHVIQNMVYFKSGNYYFMVVPRSSTATAEALQLAPISTPITEFLDNFTKRVDEIISTLVPINDYAKFPRLATTAERLSYLVDFYSVLDNGIVRNIYKYRLVDKEKNSNAVLQTLLYYDFIINYDTVTRVWSCYLVQASPTRTMPYQYTLTSNTIYALLSPTVDVDNTNHCLTFMRADNNRFSDDYTLSNKGVVVAERLINNNQYLDTGYREQNSQVKKRYREVQFKINNIANKPLYYATTFYIDDVMRKDMFKYETRIDADPASASYGTLYLNKSYDDVTTVHNIAQLSDKYAIVQEGLEAKTRVLASGVVNYDADKWLLDVSALTDVAVVKVRLNVSGKGYAPRLKFVSFNAEAYELTSINWVYREMNAR